MMNGNEWSFALLIVFKKDFGRLLWPKLVGGSPMLHNLMCYEHAINFSAVQRLFGTLLQATVGLFG